MDTLLIFHSTLPGNAVCLGCRCSNRNVKTGVRIMRLVSGLEVFNWLHN